MKKIFLKIIKIAYNLIAKHKTPSITSMQNNNVMWKLKNNPTPLYTTIAHLNYQAANMPIAKHVPT